jgi:hypothetical protein
VREIQIRDRQWDFAVILMLAAVVNALCQIANAILEIGRSAGWWQLRRATMDDALDVLAWRNDPQSDGVASAHVEFQTVTKLCIMGTKLLETCEFVSRSS